MFQSIKKFSEPIKNSLGNTVDSRKFGPLGDLSRGAELLKVS